MSGRKMQADEFDYIRARMHELRNERKLDNPFGDEEEAAASNSASGHDFTLWWSPAGKPIFRANTQKAVDRAATWTRASDGTYRKLGVDIPDKLRSQGFTIEER